MVGAGAAGLLASIFAARSGSSVTLVESTKDGGRKIIISGGGRCNILPSVAAPERYVTDSSPNSLKKILRSWPLAEQIQFFETELGMELVREEETGKLFPESDKARDVRDGLVRSAKRAGAEIVFDTRVTGIKKTETGWVAKLKGRDDQKGRAIILATGGLSVPATGSDGMGLEVLKKMGVSVSPTYPALTPLTNDPSVHSHLAGLSLEVTIRAPGARPRFETTGGFLFTHRGYSGPAVLDASHLAVRSMSGEKSQTLSVQWTRLNADDWNAALKPGNQALVTALSRAMPKRLANQLVFEADLPADQSLSQLGRKDRQRLIRLLCDYPLQWTGNTGFKKAEVTGGGVALDEVHPNTLECKRHPGLFLCGELLDAFGPIGGHNFLWAWATGRAAGLGAARKVTTKPQ